MIRVFNNVFVRHDLHPKAVFLADLSDHMTYWDYFSHGVIDTIYLEATNLHCINKFPSAIQTIIKKYKTRSAKQERGLFIKMHSSFPIFDEDSQLLVPSITLANMGISNGSKPQKMIYLTKHQHGII